MSEFTEGVDTVVGERGVKLSGGQKQRVAIARGVVHNPRILIFDEATSALDAQSEEKVTQALENLMKGKEHTIIVIAHRLSTVRTADYVAVIDQGIVAEYGRHDELLLKDGLYKELVKNQLQ